MDPNLSSRKLLLWVKGCCFSQANTEASSICELWELTWKS